MSKHRAKVLITAELMKRMLHLPEDITIRYAEYDTNTESIVLYMAGGELPEVAEGAVAPTVDILDYMRED